MVRIQDILPPVSRSLSRYGFLRSLRPGYVSPGGEVAIVESRGLTDGSLKPQVEVKTDAQGKFLNLKTAKGERVVEYPFSVGMARYTWDFTRLPRVERNTLVFPVLL